MNGKDRTNRRGADVLSRSRAPIGSRARAWLRWLPLLGAVTLPAQSRTESLDGVWEIRRGSGPAAGPWQAFGTAPCTA